MNIDKNMILQVNLSVSQVIALRLLTGNISGGSEFRNLTDKIWDNLGDTLKRSPLSIDDLRLKWAPKQHIFAKDYTEAFSGRLSLLNRLSEEDILLNELQSQAKEINIKIEKIINQRKEK
jgi:hypothetical protein